jgi:hypothetical protein
MRALDEFLQQGLHSHDELALYVLFRRANEKPALAVADSLGLQVTRDQFSRAYLISDNATINYIFSQSFATAEHQGLCRYNRYCRMMRRKLSNIFLFFVIPLQPVCSTIRMAIRLLNLCPHCWGFHNQSTFSFCAYIRLNVTGYTSMLVRGLRSAYDFVGRTASVLAHFVLATCAVFTRIFLGFGIAILLLLAIILMILGIAVLLDLYFVS